ncbi:MAG: transglutaminase family protein [Gammaproteobacteria bacterium]
MSIKVAIRHHTRYSYDRPVQLFPHVFRLRPAVHSRTPIEAYSLKIQPEDHFINWQQDPFGNFLARVVFPEPARELQIDVEVIADLKVINPFDFFVEEYADEFPFEYEEQLAKELIPYLEIKESGPLLLDYMTTVDRTPRNIVNFLVELNQALYNHIEYCIRMEPGVQTCEETLQLRKGSCRDSAFLLVQILRRLGLAARFVSGYLVQLKPDVESLDGPSGPTADFTDLHAWCEVYVPGAGWIGLDPTSGLFAGEGHIPLACTPDPVSAAPVTGATGKCEVEFEYANVVDRIHEDPRVTKPYTDEQWDHIQALGHRVDEELIAGDVRLTMGGEPTFVSIDDMEGPEWNTTADSPAKRKLAHSLFLAMQKHFATGGVKHYGQGKWYPGEPLPRWQYACYWRKDGYPLWHNPALMADPNHDYGFTVRNAEQFMKQLGHELKLPERFILPAYEDAVYYLWQEGNLPAEFDPLAKNLKLDAERKRLLEHLQRGLDQPVGYTLPLSWDYYDNSWHSCSWTFRRGHLHLVPGDSPIGMRLPLEVIHWLPPSRREYHQPMSLFEDAGTLPYFPPNLMPIEANHTSEKNEKEQFIQTALCVEARNGVLFVFLPPLTHGEQFIALVHAIESAAAKLSMPVVLEGYSPPKDLRLEKFMVTPDPGVIEVNIHPMHSWDELQKNTHDLYDIARKSRLGTEKFLLDGRHTGTGGGNHVTLGGATPADSPLLRRPDVLRSLITFWQHHPGLSYLFSGMFIGPTSQAPRVDEGRNESLYELEIAFSQMPEGEINQPWLVDRLLRNLLVDISGNTHRSEFCIDKLYSPDSPTGRLGILEFRGFEMPPHARMSLVQMLLLRTLVAMFWKQPYKHKLVRWRTELHDRFMLPHFVMEDVKNVCEFMQQSGYPFRAEWLDPFLEFRFPHYGRTRIGDIKIELQAAIEPWHVMGEEVVSSGTARFVDSSVERIQVKVTGLCDNRYVLACNGRSVPLRYTGTEGEYVAGVRFRAWQPPSALHPTIGVHSPLVFDLIDTFNGRSVGGCTYHVHHAGGRSYDTFPVNAYEAEGRRISRYWGIGHTQGPIEVPPELRPFLNSGDRFYPHGRTPQPMSPPPEETNREYPYTLDLRRPGRLS